MSDIAFSMSSDEKDVVRGLQSVGKETGKLREQISGLVTASKEAGAADSAIAQQRLASLNAVVEKQKALKQQTDALNAQLKEGKITAEQYKQSFDAVAKESNELTTELRKLQTQVNEDSADFKKAAVIIGQTDDKTQKYAKSVAELNRLKEKGILDSKQHAAALAAEQAKLNDTGAAADKSGGMISGLTGKMAAFVGGLASASAVIAVLKSEYDALIERQGKSADANISLAAEEEALIGNLGGANATEVFGNVQQLSKTSGVKQEVVTRAVNEAMAARGDLGVNSIVDAVGSVSKIRKFAPSEMAGLAAATVDTQKQTGLGTDDSLGFLLQLQSQSRTSSLKNAAENLTPAVGGIMKMGADRQTAGALLASLSQGMGDRTGAQSKTSGISLANQLREFAPGQDLASIIADLQGNDQYREAFLGNASFEVQAIPTIESLLSGGDAAKNFANARTSLSQDPKLALQNAINDRGASSAIGLAEADQRFGNTTDQFQLGDKAGAMSGIARKRLSELRLAMGRSGIGTKIDGVLDDLSTGGMQDADSAINAVERLSGGFTDKKDVARSRYLAAGNFDFNKAQDRDRFNKGFGEEWGKTKEGQQEALLKQLVEELKGMRADQAGAAHAGVVAGRAAQKEGNP